MVERNYKPGTMSWADGFLGAKGDVGYFMAVDEEKAKEIILAGLSQGRDITHAVLGLDGDWDCNSTIIYKDGYFFKYEGYPGSIWAIPILLIYYSDGQNERYDCWKKEEG